MNVKFIVYVFIIYVYILWLCIMVRRKCYDLIGFRLDRNKVDKCGDLIREWYMFGKYKKLFSIRLYFV